MVDRSSPQSVFEAYQKAIDRQDWEQLYETLSPKSRERMLGVLFYSLTMAAAGRDLKSEAYAVLNKHGIDFAKAGREAAGAGRDNKSAIDAVLRQVDDKAAFFSDLVRFSIRYNPGGEGEPFTRFEYGSLRDVRIDGEEAEGMITVGMKEKPARGDDQPSGPARATAERTVPLRFRRIMGRWYVALEGVSWNERGGDSQTNGAQTRDREAPPLPGPGTPPPPVQPPR